VRDAGEPLSPQASGVGYGSSGTFLPGQVVYADPAAGSTEQQLLYQAIGAANLRIWADTDAAGHVALSN
jgi:hypothetical protein